MWRESKKTKLKPYSCVFDAGAYPVDFQCGGLRAITEKKFPKNKRYYFIIAAVIGR